MPSVPPPTSGESVGREPAKRPRYLAWALIGALLFGAGCWTDGCSRLAFYRGERDQAAALTGSIRSDTERARAEALYRHFTDLADAARARAIPLAAATFVLGAALLALAARGFAGKANTRTALIQIVTAQAVVVAASYFLLGDVARAELQWDVERTLIHQHETMRPERYERMIPWMRGIGRHGIPVWLSLRSVASGLIVFALTRRRSREFFEAAGQAVSEG